MAQADHIIVRAKVVLVVSHLDHSNHSKEESQSTLKFDIKDKISDAEYATLIALYKSGRITADMGPE